MKIRLLLVGRTERGAVGESVAAYVKRIERLTTFEQVVVAEAGAGAPAYQQRVKVSDYWWRSSPVSVWWCLMSAVRN